VHSPSRGGDGPRTGRGQATNVHGNEERHEEARCGDEACPTRYHRDRHPSQPEAPQAHRGGHGRELHGERPRREEGDQVPCQVRYGSGPEAGGGSGGRGPPCGGGDVWGVRGTVVGPGYGLGNADSSLVLPQGERAQEQDCNCHAVEGHPSRSKLRVWEGGSQGSRRREQEGRFCSQRRPGSHPQEEWTLWVQS